MLGSFLSRTLLLIFGYAYPAYECFKIVEISKTNHNNNKPEIEQLVTWCQFWILVAVLTVLERVGDVFFSWLPFYVEAKLGFVIYLWSSKMKGTKYIYGCFFQPFMAQHEEEIDKKICKIKSNVWSFANIYWEKAMIIGQTKFLEILQSFSSTESSISRPSHHDKPEIAKGLTEEERDSNLLEIKETESKQHKAFDKEATQMIHGNWRKMFSSSSNLSD